MHSTRYTIMFTVGMTVIVALILSGMFTSLKPVHDFNEATYNKKQILGAVSTPLGVNTNALSDKEVANYFSKIEQIVVNHKGEIVEKDPAGKMIKAEEVNMEKEEKKPLEDRLLPVFILQTEKGEKFYILSMRGNGLWDKIWGWVALSEDKTTIAGAAFGHKSETPGLGAEITDNPNFRKKLEGKKIYDEKGGFTSVVVKKGAEKNDPHAIDAISGATITSVGVSNMMHQWIAYYEPYLKSLK